MSGLDLIFRIPLTLMMIIAVGTVGVFGFLFYAEPMYLAFGAPSYGLGWGDPGMQALEILVVGVLGLLAIIIVWFVAAPIQSDVRQEVR